MGATASAHQAGILETGPGRVTLPGSLLRTKQSWELRTKRNRDTDQEGRPSERKAKVPGGEQRCEGS